MARSCEDLRSCLLFYLELMEEERYFEAHEVLESVWYPIRRERTPLRNLLKALINGAVAFEHLKRGRKGAADRAGRAMAAFDRYRSLCGSEMEESELLHRACCKVESIRELNGEFLREPALT